MLEVEPADDGFQLRFAALKFERVGDGNIPSETVEELERAASAAMPFFSVDSRGQYLGLSDDLFIKKRTQELRVDLKVTQLPLQRAEIDAKAAGYWQSWVEGWMGTSVSPGETTRGTASTRSPTALASF